MGCKVALGDICSFSRGASVPRARMFDKGDFLYIHYGDLYKGFNLRIDVENPAKPIPYISGDEKIKDSQRLCDQDIVYVLTSETVDDLGHAYLFNNPLDRPAVSGTETTVVRVERRDLIVPAYLNYLLSTPHFISQLRQYVRGMKVFRVHPNDVARIEVELPSISAQKQIVAVLDTIYEKQQVNAKLNGYLLELLKASAKNLYKEYECNEELELPVGWRWIEVDEISEMVCRGITPKYNPYSDETVLGQTCVRNNLVLLENGRLHSPKKVTEKWLQKYDLLINSTVVGSLGRTAQVWFEPTKLVVDSHVTIVRCKDKKHALYLGFWAFEHEKYIESLHTGSTGQTELPRDHVKAIRLVLPSDEALERFNKMSEPSVRLIAANQEENKRLADLRDALLPKLVSGEIDVSKVDLTQLNSHLATDLTNWHWDRAANRHIRQVETETWLGAPGLFCHWRYFASVSNRVGFHS